MNEVKHMIDNRGIDYQKYTLRCPTCDGKGCAHCKQMGMVDADVNYSPLYDYLKLQLEKKNEQDTTT